MHEEDLILPRPLSYSGHQMADPLPLASEGDLLALRHQAEQKVAALAAQQVLPTCLGLYRKVVEDLDLARAALRSGQRKQAQSLYVLAFYRWEAARKHEADSQARFERLDPL